jgi:hypothetical protein
MFSNVSYRVQSACVVAFSDRTFQLGNKLNLGVVLRMSLWDKKCKRPVSASPRNLRPSCRKERCTISADE